MSTTKMRYNIFNCLDHLYDRLKIFQLLYFVERSERRHLCFKSWNRAEDNKTILFLDHPILHLLYLYLYLYLYFKPWSRAEDNKTILFLDLTSTSQSPLSVHT